MRTKRLKAHWKNVRFLKQLLSDNGIRSVWRKFNDIEKQVEHNNRFWGGYSETITGIAPFERRIKTQWLFASLLEGGWLTSTTTIYIYIYIYRERET